MKNIDCIVKGDYVLPMASDGPEVIEQGAVAVHEGKILEVGPAADIASKYRAVKTLGGPMKAVMPGLINTHTHAAMTLMRGMADDLPLMQWLQEHIWPAEGKWLSPEFIRDGVALACLEMLKAGVTTFADMYFFEAEAGHTVKSMGMKAVLGTGILDFPTSITQNADDCIKNAELLVSTWKGDPLITPAIAPHAPYTCSADTLKKALDFARKHEVLMHIHLSETKWEVEEFTKNHGMPPGQRLAELGVFDHKVIAAHCVWLQDHEIEIMARKGVGVAHCIESNLKLASGIAPVKKMLDAGIKVGLGTDGAASNNDLDIMGEMATAAKVHKAVNFDPTVVNARTALLMATRWGAEALGLMDTGFLAPGKSADLVVIDLNKPHLTPIYNIQSHLVYCTDASDVQDVMVNGKVVVESGRHALCDEASVMDNARQWASKIKS